MFVFHWTALNKAVNPAQIHGLTHTGLIWNINSNMQRLSHLFPHLAYFRHMRTTHTETHKHTKTHTDVCEVIDRTEFCCKFHWNWSTPFMLTGPEVMTQIHPVVVRFICSWLPQTTSTLSGNLKKCFFNRFRFSPQIICFFVFFKDPGLSSEWSVEGISTAHFILTAEEAITLVWNDVVSITQRSF